MLNELSEWDHVFLNFLFFMLGSRWNWKDTDLMLCECEMGSLAVQMARIKPFIIPGTFVWFPYESGRFSDVDQ